MKNLKISLSAFALVLGIGFALVGSNPAKAKNNHLTTSWFAYNGSGIVTAPSSYTEIVSPSCPTGTTHLCAIQAPVGSGSKPVIDDTLAGEITNAVNDGVPSDNVELKL